ncbi:MAG: hypothetical protein HWQ35_02170 [Nostoc sp. NMS1]|uniref:hypothetical protein n=1 Tax=unclassified Nostoc TaxID=2593658 RepID=UPI0025D20F03|nr:MULTISPECIES: hypothetical protein [unclassified Nostoc]MBN3905423.1 hypothetical protein [Nostoc sp. NMS1]MBN3991863.1 hypothetical protein [Nostoc sp. NMS2]
MLKRRGNKRIIFGFFLLIIFHIVAAILALGIASMIGRNPSGYKLARNIIVYGIYGFFLWQLIYVIPLCLWLKNKGKIYVMKGVIIAAIITFLVYFGCFLLVTVILFRVR